MNKKYLIQLLGLFTLLVSICLAVSIGGIKIPFDHVIGILAKEIGLPIRADWPAWEQTIVVQVRLPRVLVGIVVGGGLALCGLVLQALFRNPLAEPGVLGVSSGAGLGAVIAIYINLSSVSVWCLPLFSILGAGLTALAVYSLATRWGQKLGQSLLLSGIAVGSFNAAFTSLIISLALANYDIGRQMIFWLMGGLDGRTWDHVFLVTPIVLLGSAIVFAHLKDLDAIILGESHAYSVGVDVAKLRKNLILAASLVTGSVVAVSGTVGFVGLVVPHILRLLLGPRHSMLAPTSLLSGAIFIVLADLVSRTLIAPEEIRLGIVTATIGSPFFLYLLIRHKRGDA